MLRTVIDLVLPPRCPGCRAIVAGDGRFCLECWQQLRFITAPMCARCGTPFEHDRGAGAECGPCLAEPPRYATARAALVYGGPARSVLLALKHGDRQHLARVMAPHMARAGGDMLASGVLLVPVPLHRWRLWRRGFNQAALLAQALAKSSGAELAIDALLRVKPTPPSQGMGRAARARNVRGVFRVKDRNRIRGRCGQGPQPHPRAMRCVDRRRADHRRHRRCLCPGVAPGGGQRGARVDLRARRARS